MPAGLAYCRKCDENHSRPVGRNCTRIQQVGDVAATVGSVSGPAQANVNAHPTVTASISTPINSDVGSMILSKLSNIFEQIDSLDGRVRITEAALADKTTNQASGTKSSVPNDQDVAISALEKSDSIVPSTDFLKSDHYIQQQVDARLKEYQGVEPGNSGKLRSQRGGNTDVPIKRYVAWPQNYILVGPDKSRPTFDSLNPFQFMSGCIRGALDLENSEKDKNVEYLANLLEDASGFCFAKAKA